jgi:Dehydrogenases with different specificities (related to short-chain alcohol dehydrogenases)
MNIQDKIAVVTGGASGLGEAVVRRLSANGATVVFLDVADERGKALEAELGKNVAYMHCDIGSEAEAQSIVHNTLEKFGKIDILVNVAGISSPKRIVGKDGPHPLAAWEKVLHINLVGSFNMMRLCAEAMLRHDPYDEGERGVIINTSSIASFHGEAGQSAYSASKGAINSMMLPAAREFSKQGIRVMAVAPGLFHTPIYDAIPDVLEALKAKTIFPRRLGRPEEFAHAVQMIIENLMFNGDTIRLDGAVRF